jgi:phage shock protein A
MTEQLEHRVTIAEIKVREALEIAKAAREDARMALEAWRTRQRMDNELLNKLRETQIEHGQLLRQHGALLKEHGERLDRLEGKVERLEGKVTEGFAKMSLGMDTIIALLKNIERG